MSLCLFINVPIYLCKCIKVYNVKEWWNNLINFRCHFTYFFQVKTAILIMVCSLIKYLYVLLTSISACYKALFYQIAKLQKISTLIWNEKMRFIPFVQNNLTTFYRKTVVCYCLSVSKYIVTWASKRKKYWIEDQALGRYIIIGLWLCLKIYDNWSEWDILPTWKTIKVSGMKCVGIYRWF